MAQARSIWSAFALLVSMASATLAVDRATFLNRVGDTDGMRAGLAEWGPALKTATGEEVDTLALFTLLGKLDPLWGPDHKFRKEISSRSVARMKSVNENTLANWQSAFEKATGQKPTKFNTLVLMVQLDRMFDNATLNEQGTVVLRNRLRSLPEQATKEWSDLSKQDRHAATAELITLDVVFKQDVFDETCFKQLCHAVTVNGKPVQGSLPRDQANRVWRNKDGRTIEGQFLQFADGKVTLRKKSDEKTYTMPLENLSAEDQQWVKTQSPAGTGDRLDKPTFPKAPKN
jgi:cytochrome c5